MKKFKTLETVNDLLDDGKEVVVAWAEYQEGLQHSAWLESLKAEYDELFPATREETYDEYKLALSEGAEPITLEAFNSDTNIKFHVNIDYSGDATYVAFEAWKKQRKIVDVDAVVDELTGDEITPATTKEGDLVREFIADVDSFSLLSEYQPFIDGLKLTKLKTLDGATVTIGTGKVFDANERSNTRMTMAITAVQTLLDLGKLEVAETPWILADNSTVIITLTELKEAQALSTLELSKAVL